MDRVDPGVVLRQLAHERDALVDQALAQMAHVEVCVGAVLALEDAARLLLSHEGLREPVARAELHAPQLRMARVGDVERLAQVVVLEVAPSLRVEEDAALAARRLGDEDPGAGKAGGVVLDELHVLERNAGAVGHRHPVAGLDRGVGGEGEDAAATAGAEDHGFRLHDAHDAGAQLDGGDPLAAPVLDEEARREPLVVTLHLRVLEGGLEERVQHVEAGLVGGVPGPPDAHAAEGADGDAAVLLPAPRAAPVLELDHLARGLVHEGLDGVLVSEPVGAADRVVDVIVEGVVLLDHGRGAALGGDRVAAHWVDLREHRDVEIGVGLGGGDDSPQARASAADDKQVVLKVVGHRRLSSRATARRTGRRGGPTIPAAAVMVKRERGPLIF